MNELINSGVKSHLKLAQPKCGPFYAEWSEWSSCSSTCGNGIKHRTQVCDKNTEFLENACMLHGDRYESEICNNQLCDGNSSHCRWVQEDKILNCSNIGFDTLDLLLQDLKKYKLQNTTEFVRLQGVRHLDLSKNKLKHLQDFHKILHAMPNVKYVNLQQNLLEEIPKFFPTPQKLKVIDLWGNKISRLPEDPEQFLDEELAGRVLLNLQGNEIQEIPLKWIGFLEKFKFYKLQE